MFAVTNLICYDESCLLYDESCLLYDEFVFYVESCSLYDELFSVIPTNSIPTLRASKDLQTRVRPLVETFGRDIKAKLEGIRGHLVLFPTQYLEEEDLQPATLAKEGMVPQDLWK